MEFKHFFYRRAGVGTKRVVKTHFKGDLSFRLHTAQGGLQRSP